MRSLLLRPISKDAARQLAERAGLVVLTKEEARWLCDWLHGEDGVERDYDRAHALLEGDDDGGAR